MPLPLLLFAAVILYTLLVTLSSRASGRIDPFWSSTIFGAASTVAPLLAWLGARAANKAVLPSTGAGIAYSLAAGASAGIFTAILVRIFERGAVSYATPVIYGGAIAVTAAIGYMFFKEPMPPLQLTGIVLVLIGIGLVIYSRATGVPT